ncbi:HTH-type transcriptional regulator RpiR [subsurface metagenome]|nr:MAG: MurR/RpiR family transcriptional regulator [Candidatus Atribacteria bacterium 1244-E10-H5-B2]
MPIEINEKITNKIPHYCLIRLRSFYDSMESAEKKAVDLLIEDPDFIANAKIVEAAQRADCSAATFVRLAKKLGYKGYPKLKKALLEIKKDPIQLYPNINENDKSEDIVAKIFQTSIQTLSDTLNLLDKETYKKAVNAICKAQKIVLCGVGDAFPVAQSGYHKFLRIGLNVQVSADFDVQLINVSHLSKNDVAIIISHSGRTKNIVEVAKYAKIVGATVISITNYPISTLAKNSDIVLLTAVFINNVKGEVISKRITQLCILESLYINVLLKLKQKVIEDLEKSDLAVELNKL